MKCSSPPIGCLSEIRFKDRDTASGVRGFIEQYQDKLNEDQVSILTMMVDKIDGFQMYSGAYEMPEHIYGRPHYIYIFQFTCDGIRGEVTVVFE